jgi:hypothetical protein
MAYVPPWLRLPDAIERIMATERSREAAQSDICRAIADQMVKIRGRLRRHATRDRINPSVLEGKDLVIPPEIKPADLDWEHSRPLGPWAVPFKVFQIPGRWELEWIELLRTDVEDILCAPREHGRAAQHAANRPGRSRPARERAKAAIGEVYPEGVPRQADLPNKLLCKAVSERLSKKGALAVSDDTMLRVAGRRRR